MATAAPGRRGNDSSTVKAFVGQIHTALQVPTRSVVRINGIECSRLWLQGVVVSTTEGCAQCTVDDGTGVLRLELKSYLKRVPSGIDARPRVGDYVMAIGPMQKTKGSTDLSMRAMLAHQVIKLDAKQQREPMWYLEVIEYWTSVVQSAATTSTAEEQL
ncbi:unnamed protein product [Hyaloperonospora brassicae]|uniref:CST complex subunit Stn1 N-terminal domain-containing protein n=1 Tax=Hyaloperonospora brassicae TaxID=162125 RepID=A0AAV0TJE8_HYABA|nr:unnamed protein product [Hyaloperonospora brassicae]